MRLWIVVKQGRGSEGYGYRIFGPVQASNVTEAVKSVAKGTGKYVAQKRGRYFAIPLETWQEGCRDFTATRGIEHVDFPAIGPVVDRLAREVA